MTPRRRDPHRDLREAVLEPPEQYLPPRWRWFNTRDLGVLLGKLPGSVRDLRAAGLDLQPHGKRQRLWISRERLAKWLAEHPQHLSRRERRLRRRALRCVPPPWPSTPEGELRLLREHLAEHRRMVEFLEGILRRQGVTP